MIDEKMERVAHGESSSLAFAKPEGNQKAFLADNIK